MMAALLVEQPYTKQRLIPAAEGATRAIREEGSPPLDDSCLCMKLDFCRQVPGEWGGNWRKHIRRAAHAPDLRNMQNQARW